MIRRHGQLTCKVSLSDAWGMREKVNYWAPLSHWRENERQRVINKIQSSQCKIQKPQGVQAAFNKIYNLLQMRNRKLRNRLRTAVRAAQLHRRLNSHHQQVFHVKVRAKIRKEQDTGTWDGDIWGDALKPLNSQISTNLPDLHKRFCFKAHCLRSCTGLK